MIKFDFKLIYLNGNRDDKVVDIKLIEEQKNHAEICIFENQPIAFELTTISKIYDPILWISDLSIEPTRIETNSDGIVTYFWYPKSTGNNWYEPFFLNYFGICDIHIKATDIDGNQLYLGATQFEIKATKMTSDRVHKIVEYLSQKGEDIVASNYSITKIRSNTQQGRTKVLTLLSEAEDGLIFLENKLNNILAQKCTKLIPKYLIRPPRHNDKYDSTTVEWLLSHMDVLQPSQDIDDSIAIINSKYYSPSELEVCELYADTNRYENQILHGYLISMKLFMLEVQKHTNLICDTDNNNPSINGKGYHSFFKEMKNSYKKLFESRYDKCNYLLHKIDRLITIFNEKLPVTEPIKNSPILTPWVKSNIHYRRVYEKIIRWYRLGKADWESEGTLLGIRSLDKLYEFFCLYKLLDGIEDSGFYIIQPKSMHKKEMFREIQYQDDIPDKKFEFKKGKTTLTLYHEREFWSPQHKQSTGDYNNVEGWNVRNKMNADIRKGTGPYSKRVPDFSLEFSIEGDSFSAKKVLAIFDAKYSSFEKTFKETLPLLVMRYVHGISYSTGGDNPVISLFLLNPQDKNVNSIRSFHTEGYDIYGDNFALPALGVVEVDPESEFSLSNLINRISQIAEMKLLDLSSSGSLKGVKSTIDP